MLFLMQPQNSKRTLQRTPSATRTHTSIATRTKANENNRKKVTSLTSCQMLVQLHRTSVNEQNMHFVCEVHLKTLHIEIRPSTNKKTFSPSNRVSRSAVGTSVKVNSVTSLDIHQQQNTNDQMITFKSIPFEEVQPNANRSMY